MTATQVVPALAIRGLGVRYGQVAAVQDVTLAVAAGEMIAVIGPNGAGKSSLLNAVMGVLPEQGRSSGAVMLQECEVTHDPIEMRLMHGLTLVPERRELFTTMTVEDNLLLGGFRRRRAGESLLEGLERVYRIFPRLRERRLQHAGTMSGGERQMVAIGRALMSDPKVLMLDEPSLGLAPLITAEVLRVVAQLRDSGVAVVLVEQNSRAALQVADRAYVLELGTIVLEGRAAELLHDARLIDAYLGGQRSVAQGGGSRSLR